MAHPLGTTSSTRSRMFTKNYSDLCVIFQGDTGTLGETGIDGDDGAKGPKGDIGAPGLRGQPGSPVSNIDNMRRPAMYHTDRARLKAYCFA